MIRAVLDTNVILAAKLSANSTSPNQEILDRWEKEAFILLFSLDILAEYEEKLDEKNIKDTDIDEFLSLIMFLGEETEIVFYHLQHYPVDTDDTAFLLCALNGEGTHLVSYDDHLLSLRHLYADDLKFVLPLDFLTDLERLL